MLVGIDEMCNIRLSKLILRPALASRMVVYRPGLHGHAANHARFRLLVGPFHLLFFPVRHDDNNNDDDN